jgi:amidohydrolase
MFQPGEEGWNGAGAMIAEGVLDAAGPRVARAYGMHVLSGSLPRGQFGTRPGTLMAASDGLHVTVHGSGGHGSAPHRSKDPVTVAAELVLALQAMVTRQFDIFDPVVITIGTFHAGTRRNIIPDTAVFEATIRSFSPAARRKVQAASVQLCESIAVAHGLTADARYSPEYPVTVNDAAEAEFARFTAADLFGPDRTVTPAQPLTGAEDFSYVLDEVPGAFVLLGACPSGTDPLTASSNHSAGAAFDDAVIADGITLYAELALRRLAAGA